MLPRSYIVLVSPRTASLYSNYSDVEPRRKVLIDEQDINNDTVARESLIISFYNVSVPRREMECADTTIQKKDTKTQ